MANSQLYQFLKDEGYTLKEIVAATGYRYSYVCAVLNGTTPLTDAARYRFMAAFPGTRQFLLPEVIWDRQYEKG